MEAKIDRFSVELAGQFSPHDHDLIAACDRIADWHKLRPIGPAHAFYARQVMVGWFWRDGRNDEEVRALQEKVAVECGVAIAAALRKRVMSR